MKKSKILQMEMVIAGIIFLKNKIVADKNKLKSFEEKESVIYKQEEVIKVYERWVDVYQNKHSLLDYFIKNDYQQIAIYGLGRIGKSIYNEVRPSSVDIAYVVDQKYCVENEFYEDTPCFGPGNELPKVDLIIVTIPGEAREITAFLKSKVNCPVKSINDVLFVI